MKKKDIEMIESIIGALISIRITTGGDYSEEIAWLRKLEKKMKTTNKKS